MISLANQHRDTLYLEWAIANNEITLLFALSHTDGLQTFILPFGYDTLTEMTAQWLEALTAHPTEDQNIVQRQAMYQLAKTEPAVAQMISNKLLAPLYSSGILTEGRYSRLVIVADGPLLDIPFAALTDHQGKRLIECYAISTSISLGMLNWPNNRKEATRSLLCVVGRHHAEDHRQARPPRLTQFTFPGVLRALFIAVLPHFAVYGVIAI